MNAEMQPRIKAVLERMTNCPHSPEACNTCPLGMPVWVRFEGGGDFEITEWLLKIHPCLTIGRIVENMTPRLEPVQSENQCESVQRDPLFSKAGQQEIKRLVDERLAELRPEVKHYEVPPEKWEPLLEEVERKYGKDSTDYRLVARFYESDKIYARLFNALMDLTPDD